MAEPQTVISRPAPYLEAAGQTFLDLLTAKTGQAPTSAEITALSPQIAGQNVLTQQAQQQAATQAGLGALTFDPTTGAVTGVGQGTGIAGYQPFLQQAQQYSGPQAYQQFMSPYQQDVINTTLTEYDRQRQIAQQGIASQAIQAGAFGGGREGVQQAEFDAQSLQNRAALQAQLLQQGYGQAQQAAQQNYMNQLNLGQSAIGLGQTNVGMLGQQIAGLQTLGAGETSQQQAILEAQRQLAQQQAYQPLNIAERYGAGIQPLIAGQPGGLGYSTIKSEPTPSPLTNLLGIGSTLAGIYALTRPR